MNSTIRLTFKSNIGSLLRPVDVPLVRIGRDFDGGYVISEDALLNSNSLLSGGYGNDFSFELDFQKTKALNYVHIYDYSITWGILFKDLVWKLPKNLIFHLLGRAHGQCRFKFINIATFARLRMHRSFKYYAEMLANDPANENSKVTAITLQRAIERINVDSAPKLFLKLDIEGSEYQLIESLVEQSDHISGMVIEFHEIGGRLSHFECGIQMLLNVFKIVHVHGNNYGGINTAGIPNVLEISFLNNNLCPLNSSRSSYQSNFDQPNNPDASDYEFIFSDLAGA